MSHTSSLLPDDPLADAVVDETRPFGAFESAACDAGVAWVAGCDEAGRGALAGPLVAAAVRIRPCDAPVLADAGVFDSKQLSAAARVRAAAAVRAHAAAWAVQVRGPREVDQAGVAAVNLGALAAAARDVHVADGETVLLVDGFSLPRSATRGFRSTYRLTRGDARSVAVAAASVLAKTVRDALMVDAAARWPVYGFDRNVGYGTPPHLDALKRHGPCPQHRHTFLPRRCRSGDGDDVAASLWPDGHGQIHPR